MSLINTAVQPFTATAFHNGAFVDVTEADIAGKWSVFFFYPADFTFVCPTELGDLADKYAEFKRLGVEVYSVSTDTHFTHKAWHDTSDTIGKIKYAMLGDPTGQITRNFGMILEDAGPGLPRHVPDRPRGHDPDRRDHRRTASAATLTSWCARSRPRSTCAATRTRCARPSGKRATPRSRRPRPRRQDLIPVGRGVKRRAPTSSPSAPTLRTPPSAPHPSSPHLPEESRCSTPRSANNSANTSPRCVSPSSWWRLSTTVPSRSNSARSSTRSPSCPTW